MPQMEQKMMAKELEKFTHSLQPPHSAVHDLDSEVNLCIKHTANPSVNQKGSQIQNLPLIYK